MKFSDRAMNVEPSATVKVSNTAKAMIRKGIDVINLGIGEPDFTTPQLVADAAIKAIESGKTSFTRQPVACRNLKRPSLSGLKKITGSFTQSIKLVSRTGQKWPFMC